MKISKKRKRIRFVSKEIRGFAPQGVNRRALKVSFEPSSACSL